MLRSKKLKDRGKSINRAKDLLSDATSAWSRANFKETLPELPSPLGLSFLRDFMQRNIIRHYVELGCDIPPDLSCVRIIQGRPFINVSLLQLVVAQLGGCLLYTSPSPRDRQKSRMPSSA